ncbi:hypothetical protein [Mycobacterium sp. PSTR-4-N]|uniref:phage tail fiber protein n=1 Tax=Mycobacterium sp. PSTR-4-N TaxID=2917745 RepID=UPI001F14FFF5|nr:hypothetical protein [Mycobacterium sp. PSTR-4-N]MCG7592376.1 hypothetical protein [Mycobacterium sp. PSTR-4-N]
MAGSYFTTYFLDTVIDHNLRGEDWTPPTALYAQKHLGDPTDAGTAFPSTTTTREAVTLAAAAGGATVLASTDVNWLSTVREQVTHLSIWDAETGGHCIAIIELEESINAGIGDTIDLSSLPISFRAAEDAA